MKGDGKYIFIFLLPLGMMTSIFLYYPFIGSIYNSFHRTTGFFDAKFIGLENYLRLVQDAVIWQATRNTLELMIYVVVFQVGIALALAVMVDAVKWGGLLFRTVFFLPVVISGAAIGLLFVLIYNYHFGLLNSLLVWMDEERILWLSDSLALKAIAIPTVWHYVGFYFVLLLTAISKIPEDYYEAAKLEGITGLSKTLKLTIPLIWSDIRIVIILAITGTFKVFEMVYIVTGGGPYHKSEVLGTYMYSKAFTDQSFGYGSAIAVYIVVLGILLSLIANRLLKREAVTY